MKAIFWDFIKTPPCGCAFGREAPLIRLQAFCVLNVFSEAAPNFDWDLPSLGENWTSGYPWIQFFWLGYFGRSRGRKTY
jgi:hypothetical protein